MPTLVTTLSGATSNSYVDVAYGDAYWAGHYSTTKAALWAALNSTQKASALYHACISLQAIRFTSQDSRFDVSSLTYNVQAGVFQSQLNYDEAMRADVYQALQFPRNLDIDEAGVYSIPSAIKDAQCEQALYLTTFDEEAATATLRGLDYESVTVGQVSTTQRFTGGVTVNPATLRLSPIAIELISPYLIRSNKLRRG